VLNQASLSVALPHLENLTKRCEDVGGLQPSRLWDQGHERAGHMIEDAPV